MSTGPSTYLQTGRTLGHYQLVRPLERKYATEVWLGQHIYLHTPVALKILALNAVQEDELPHYESRLHNEACILANFHHPHIVGFRDYYLSPSFRYIVMQYAPYGSLGHYYALGRKPPLAQVRLYTWQVANALDVLHRQHVIHRDVKPGNILLLHTRHALLADFGLSMLDPTLSSRSRLVRGGTAAYMAPEQYDGHPCQASDQYGLATCVYEWLTGQQPFADQRSLRYRTQIYLTPVSAFHADLPATIDEILLTALDPDPARRFPTVLDFARALVTETRTTRKTRFTRPMDRKLRETAELERRLPTTRPINSADGRHRLFNQACLSAPSGA